MNSGQLADSEAPALVVQFRPTSMNDEPADALLAFLAYVGKQPLVAYHALFDHTIIARAMQKYLGYKFAPFPKSIVFSGTLLTNPLNTRFPWTLW